MKLSGYVVLAGAVMFVIPEPITSILGAVTLLAGVVLRYAFGL
ncbi:transporter [Haloarchaeobius sp. TZWWS8]